MRCSAVLGDTGTGPSGVSARAVDSTKAVLKSATRFHRQAGTIRPGTATTAVNALLNTEFTYRDLGVNLEITPRIHNREELSLHMDLDVLQVKAEINLGGINEPRNQPTRSVPI